MDKKQQLLYTIGTNVKLYRESHGYTQQELAGRVGLHRNYLAGIEKGQRNLSVGALCDIASGLNINVGSLLNVESHDQNDL